MAIERVRYSVAIYEKSGDRFLKMIPLSKPEAVLIKTFLGYSGNTDLYDCYPLTGEVLTEVRGSLGDKMPEGDYDYFLEAEAV